MTRPDGGEEEGVGPDPYSCAHEHVPCAPDGGRHGEPHDHGDGVAHHHGPVGHKVRERRLLLLATGITVATMFAEFAGGWWTNSMALISDAGHMLTHSLALSLSYSAIWIASRESTPEYSFGYFRSETLAALFNSFFLLVISGILLWETYEKLLSPGAIMVPGMLAVAVLGLVVNLVTAAILVRAGPEGDLNIRGAFVHMLTDTVSSVGVVVGAIVIHFTGLVLVDPIISLMITILILAWVYKLARSAIRVLLERTPRHLDVPSIVYAVVGRVPEVKDIHDVHIWEITTNMYNMTAHVVLDDVRLHEAMPVISRVKEVLRKEFNIGHAIIQLECTCVTG